MSEELITLENVSKDMLKAIFDAALMDTTLDSDGDILIKDRCRVYVLPDVERRRIRLLAQFGFVPSASEHAKLDCANRINSDYIIVRASVHGDKLRFSYDVSLDGGITKKAMALLVKRFCSIPQEAVADYGKDIVQ
jgi:hypothetical protein